MKTDDTKQASWEETLEETISKLNRFIPDYHPSDSDDFFSNRSSLAGKILIDEYDANECRNIRAHEPSAEEKQKLLNAYAKMASFSTEIWIEKRDEYRKKKFESFYNFYDDDDDDDDLPF